MYIWYCPTKKRSQFETWFCNIDWSDLSSGSYTVYVSYMMSVWRESSVCSGHIYKYCTHYKYVDKGKATTSVCKHLMPHVLTLTISQQYNELTDDTSITCSHIPYTCTTSSLLRGSPAKGTTSLALRLVGKQKQYETGSWAILRWVSVSTRLLLSITSVLRVYYERITSWTRVTWAHNT